MSKRAFQHKELCEIAEISSGNSAPQGLEHFVPMGSGTPFVRMQDLGRYGKTSNLTEVADYIKETTSKKLKIFPVGSILIPKSGASIRLNYRAILGINAHVVSHLAIIQAKPSYVLNKYLYYWLHTIDFSDKAHDADLPSLKLSDLANLEVPTPSLEVQNEIIRTLDQIDDLRQKQRKAIELTRQMIPALFYEMFGDIETNEKGFDKIKLQDVTTINPKDKVNLKDSDEVTFVPMSAINAENGTILIPEVKLVIEAKRKGFSCFKEGDVLFAKITPCMQNKKSAIAKHLLNGLGYGSTEFHVLRPSSLILAEYLLRILRSSKFIEIAKKHFTGTAGQQRVPKDFIANFTISLPPIELQKRYADKVQEIRSLLEHQEQSIQKLDVLFETTLNQFFS